jgi:hypothetical protein
MRYRGTYFLFLAIAQYKGIGISHGEFIFYVEYCRKIFYIKSSLNLGDNTSFLVLPYIVVTIN